MTPTAVMPPVGRGVEVEATGLEVDDRVVGGFDVLCPLKDSADSGRLNVRELGRPD
jgi:hypothetical protein